MVVAESQIGSTTNYTDCITLLVSTEYLARARYMEILIYLYSVGANVGIIIYLSCLHKSRSFGTKIQGWVFLNVSRHLFIIALSGA